MKRILVCLAAFAGLASCGYELCYEHPHTGTLRVVFDWRETPDAAPGSMSLYLFPEAGGEPLRYEFAGCAGGVVTVPEGTYRAFCLNSDTERVLYRDTEQWERFECRTRTTELLAGYGAYGVRSETVPRAEGTADERIAATPDPLWSDRAERVAVTKGDARTLTLYPSTAVCTYTVEIRNAENLKYAAALGGSLSSLSGGFLPGTGATTGERVTVPFDAAKSEDRTALHARFLAFGQPADKRCARIERPRQVVLHLRRDRAGARGARPLPRAYPARRPAAAQAHSDRRRIPSRRGRVADREDRHRPVTKLSNEPKTNDMKSSIHSLIAAAALVAAAACSTEEPMTENRGTAIAFRAAVGRGTRRPP